MAQKLMALVKGECSPETLDNPQFQEAAVSGHILLFLIRDRLQQTLINLRRKLEINMRKKSETFIITSYVFKNRFKIADSKLKA